jgi:hypothetical protein
VRVERSSPLVASAGGPLYGRVIRLRPRHRASYHEQPVETPVIDVVRTVIAVASVLIGSYAALFLILALAAGDERLARENALFFVVIALANGVVDAVRDWRRHHA